MKTASDKELESDLVDKLIADGETRYVGIVAEIQFG